MDQRKEKKRRRKVVLASDNFKKEKAPQGTYSGNSWLLKSTGGTAAPPSELTRRLDGVNLSACKDRERSWIKIRAGAKMSGVACEQRTEQQNTQLFPISTQHHNYCTELFHIHVDETYLCRPAARVYSREAQTYGRMFSCKTKSNAAVESCACFSTRHIG